MGGPGQALFLLAHGDAEVWLDDHVLLAVLHGLEVLALCLLVGGVLYARLFLPVAERPVAGVPKGARQSLRQALGGWFRATVHVCQAAGGAIALIAVLRWLQGWDSGVQAVAGIIAGIGAGFLAGGACRPAVSGSAPERRPIQVAGALGLVVLICFNRFALSALGGISLAGAVWSGLAHRLALLTWAGGVMWLAALWWAGAARLPGPQQRALQERWAAAFSPYAAGSVAVLAVAGPVNLKLHGSLGHTYGAPLWLKMGLLGLALVCAAGSAIAGHAHRLRPFTDTPFAGWMAMRFGRFVLAEAVLLLAVATCGVILSVT